MLLAAAGLAVTSIVAGGATAIYAAWHFQQMPSLGLFTNLTAMPIVSAVVMPFAVLGALAMPFGLDGPFFDVMGLGLHGDHRHRALVLRALAGRHRRARPAGIRRGAHRGAAHRDDLFDLAARRGGAGRAGRPAVLLVDRPQPDLFVSEDGRLVGLAVGDGRIAVNRARPNEFTIDNWQRAMRADEIVRPEGKQERATRTRRSGAECGAALTRPSPVDNGERGHQHAAVAISHPLPGHGRGGEDEDRGRGVLSRHGPAVTG